MRTLDEKAVELNRRLREQFPDTPEFAAGELCELVTAYNEKENKSIRYLLEMVLWKAFGIYHRDYLEWVPMLGEQISVALLEEEIDGRLVCQP